MSKLVNAVTFGLLSPKKPKAEPTKVMPEPDSEELMAAEDDAMRRRRKRSTGRASTIMSDGLGGAG